MQEIRDTELLRQYVRDNSEPAFAALVARHVNLVYSAALRKTGNPAAAEEITQAVFVILAKKAGQLSAHVALSGWLYQTARLTAANFQRTEIRRAAREQEAYMQSLSHQTEPEAWSQIVPLLEDAMGRLGEKDRNAIALRFFEGKSFSEVGAAFGATENAAKKRVAHALEKLRHYFSRHGVTSTAAIIAVVLSANSVQAAPPALASTATAVALAKGATASTSTLVLIKGALKIMAWTKTQTTLTVGAIVVLTAITTGVAVKTLHARAQSRDAGKPAPSVFSDPSKHISPFTLVQFDDADSNKVTVVYGGTRYQLAAVNGVPVTDILNFCRNQYGSGALGEAQAEKRFSEDLLVVMADMGHAPASDNTISLTLIDPQSGRQQTIDRATMTARNRSFLMQNRSKVDNELAAAERTAR